MPKPLCFVDSTYYYRAQYPAISRALADYPSICQVGDRAFQFKVVGILYAAGQPIAVFPKNYGDFQQETDYTKEAKTLARVLIRYKNEPLHEDSEQPLLFGDASLSSSRISAAMFLLEDYCQNGIIRRQSEISTTRKSGRIDWAATINKTDPIISKSRPLYVNPINRRRTSDENNIVCVIHRYVIDNCFREWGWCFGYDDYKEPRIVLPISITEAVICLNNELRNIYVERDIKVIKALIRYLHERFGINHNNRIDVLATPYFAFVWESVCGFIFANQYSRLKGLLPQPTWESDVIAGQISQRPDIFHVNGAGLYILDAKYYNYYSNLPGWHDVVKQFFYRHTLCGVMQKREFVRLLPQTREIYNAFIFPGSGGDFSYVGRVHVPMAADLGEIRAFALNQMKALSSYAYRDDSYFNESVRQKVREDFI